MNQNDILWVAKTSFRIRQPHGKQLLLYEGYIPDGEELVRVVKGNFEKILEYAKENGLTIKMMGG